MPTRPRVLHFDVTVDAAGDARSALGGSPIPKEDEWWAEHLVLAGLVRCTLASMDYAARRAVLEKGRLAADGAAIARNQQVEEIRVVRQDHCSPRYAHA